MTKHETIDAAGRAALDETMQALGKAAREAAAVLGRAGTETKNKALAAMAAAIRSDKAKILIANAEDMGAARAANLTGALLDRLALDDKRVEAMAKGIDEIRAQEDPIGRITETWTRPNGLAISRVKVPLGAIGIIYESRPNVTADAGALCIKAGNAVILRGGSESFHSSRAIHACLVRGLKEAGLPEAAVSLVATRDRAAVGMMLEGLGGAVDVIVPRGGKSLVERVQREARVPVLAHLEGLCHTYVDKAADLAMARKIVMNAKMRRTGICGATETLLVDKAAAKTHLAPLIADLLEAKCEVRGDAAAQAVDPRVKPAVEQDWYTEYLDAIIAVKLVEGVDEAISHIEHYGSHHTDAIVTDDTAAAERFLTQIDSAILLWNASTQFADGGEFGMGAEIGIATGKFHARGPVGVNELTSYKYIVRGNGQVRPG
jgi:glutamate-5-semialdehyde dehydrogenase